MRRPLADLARSERGMAVPTVLAVIILGLGLSSAAIMSSISVQTGSSRDSDSKEALAAADAAVELAVYRQNVTRTTPTDPCVVAAPTGALSAGDAAADGWCPEVTGTVGESSYAYRVSPWTTTGTTATGVRRRTEVVAVGSQDGVNRRVNVSANARDGSGVFGGFGAIGVDQVTIGGSSDVGTPTLNTDVATNGSVVTAGNGSLCGNVSVGVDEDFVNGGNWCPGYTSTEQTLSLPLVDDDNVWVENDNDRFFTDDPVQPASAVTTNCSSVTGNKGAVCWDPVTHTLTMAGNAILSLGGANYSFCRLQMSGNSQLLVAEGASVNIFLHSPEQCQMTGDPVNQINLTGNTRIATTSTNPGDLRILLVGSEDIATSVNMHGTSKQEHDFTLYGPLTDILLQGNPTYRGAMAGKTLTTDGSAELVQQDGATGATINVRVHYQRDRYVECSDGDPQSPPDSFC